MTPESYQLVMRSGPNPGSTYLIDKDEITIGRAISNDIVINDAEVSRQHARLISSPGGYVLEDTGSTNGTFVNGQRLVGPHLLRPGELILLGENISLAYERTEIDPDATRAASYPVREPDGPPPRREELSYEPIGENSGPVDVFDYDEEEEERPARTWIYIGCGCLAVLLCALALGAVAFDQLNLYCEPPFDAFFACP